MKPYIGQLLLIISFVIISLIPPFYLFQKPITTENLKNNHSILGIKAQKEAALVRLKIPSINVDTPIQSVGVTSQGTMEVPSNVVSVGWFKFGPLPGERGSAVISGHLTGESGELAVFANLHKLKGGDRLYIEKDNGTTTTFIVRESRIYNPGYAEEVYSLNDGFHLNLITCDGIWDGIKESYSKRLVVFADMAQ